jgi:UDP-N-acetylmuramoylalanine--D-glutamate ligase
VLDRAALPVPGEHNVANALAAALACRLAGVAVERIADGLCAYRPLAHRLERIGTFRGAEYYNDSKATNPDSTVRAVRSFAPGSVVLILGGRDKGADWSALGRAIAGAVRQVLLVGEASEAIAAGLGETVPVERCGSVVRAIAAGAGVARPGDVVLLSPGSASFDQYRNFEERGDDFRRAVLALARGGEDRRA